MTGLEAAMVLIAFIVVAAVISYIVLGGVVMTTGSTGAESPGLPRDNSPLAISGKVYGIGAAATADTAGAVARVNFSVVLVPGASPVDFATTAVTFSNSSRLEPLVPVLPLKGEPAEGHWAVTRVQNEQGTANTLLESGEVFGISLMPTGTLPPEDQFTIVIAPAPGIPLDFTRTTPANLTVVTILGG
jgi:flagellin FlaB